MRLSLNYYQFKTSRHHKTLQQIHKNEKERNVRMLLNKIINHKKRNKKKEMNWEEQQQQKKPTRKWVITWQ